MQGRSLVPLLSGEVPPSWRDVVYYRYWMHLSDHDTPAHFGIRTQRYKLIFFCGLPLDATGAVPEPTPPGWELYDLAEDPAETSNVYGAPGYAAVTAELKARLLTLRREAGDEDAAFPEVAERMAACP